MKRVKLVPHDSIDSRESIEMDEYSDEEDEVFLRHGGENGGGGSKRNGAHSRLNSDSAASRPLMKKRKRGKVSGGTRSNFLV